MSNMENIPNLNDVKPPGVIEPGLYIAKIELVNQKQTKKDGKDMLEVGFRLLGTDDMLFSYFVYESDIALRQLKELVLACGLNGDGGFPITQLEDCKVGIDVRPTGDANFPTKIRRYIDPADPEAAWVNGEIEDDLPF
jgi:hypothetical protein